jgi:hypothetical protein
MSVNRKVILALIAGIALNRLLGPQVEHLRGLVDSVVLTELVLRIWYPDNLR